MALFKRRSKQVSDSKEVIIQLGSHGGLTPSYYASSGNIEESEAGASCIQTNATYASKAEFMSVRILDSGDKVHDYPQLDKILQYSPNPLQTAAVFWERTATYYWKYNNAFIYIERDAYFNIIALWSIDPSQVEFKKISTGEIILRFVVNGKTVELPYSMIIHIAKNVTSDVMFGSTNSNNAIKKVLDIINLNYKGIENAIMTSAAIRYIGEMNTKVNDAELKKKARQFTKNYLDINKQDQIGIAFSDSSYKLTPVQQNQQKTATYAEANLWNQAVYKFFGCPEKVINGTATEEELTAYYDRTIEPFFIKASQELTRKIFSDKEFGYGNRILYNDRKILYMTTKTRLALFNSAREIGCFTLGTLGDLLGLPVPSGKRNVVVTSQNYNDSLKDQEKKPTKDNEEEKGDNENA